MGMRVFKTVAAHGLVNGRGPLEEWEGFSFENPHAHCRFYLINCLILSSN